MKCCRYYIFELCWFLYFIKLGLYPTRKFVSSVKCCQSPDFVSEGMQMVQKVRFICVHAMTHSVKHHECYGYLNTTVFVACCLGQTYLMFCCSSLAGQSFSIFEKYKI